jgi:sigma-B regulation protein RsbU (phosphoserine phosphatase)
MVHALVEQTIPTSSDPGEFLTAINRDLITILRRMRIELFVSSMYLVANIATGELRYANAGHPSPLHLKREEGVVEPLRFEPDTLGPVLGVFDEAEYQTNRCALTVGDLIVLFTDGLYEVEGSGDDEDYDEDRLLAAVRQRIAQPSTALFDGLLSEIQQFSASGEFEDDVCLVGMEVAKLGI